MQLKRIVVVVCTLAFAAGTARVHAGWNWTPLDFPDKSNTQPRAISGDTIVGSYMGPNGGPCGFAYSNGTWTSINYPDAYFTSANGVDGANIVGDYNDTYQHGFLYNTQSDSWTPIDYPGAGWSACYGISGNTVVGQYTSAGSTSIHGFVYGTAGYKSLDYPGAIRTEPCAISGNTLVGDYWDSKGGIHGFTYDMPADKWATLDFPNGRFTSLYGIDGGNIVGYTNIRDVGMYGCLYNGSTWTAMAYPGSASTSVYGISGNTVVGYYGTSSDTRWHGFIATLTPEPATLSLVALCGVFALRRGRQ